MEKKQTNYDSNSEEEDAEVLSPVDIKTLKQKNKMNNRNSVSAEAYGIFNKKADFKPVQIAKSSEAIQKINNRLTMAFMFQNLSQQELKIVVDAMQVQKYNKDDKVITQGDDGDVLYVVEEGQLNCFKRFKENDKDTFLKTYVEGESFGELALLYNAPRAATIIVKTDVAVCYVLDRATFNHIVKDSAAKKRNQYESFLKNVEILKEMDDYERLQIADCLKAVNYKPGEYIVKEGETGTNFYILEVGDCVATKTLEEGKEPTEIKQYKPGEYFGELALLRDDAQRQANVIAATNVTVCSIDQKTFKRLLGSLEDILKRNMEEYQKFMKE